MAKERPAARRGGEGLHGLAPAVGPLRRAGAASRPWSLSCADRTAPTSPASAIPIDGGWSASDSISGSDTRAASLVFRQRTNGGTPMTVTRRQFARGRRIARRTLAASPAFGQQTNENVKWRLTSSFPKSLDTLFGAAPDHRRSRRRDDRRQVRAAALRRRRDRAQPAGARRGVQRHGRMRPHLHRLLHRQEPDASSSTARCRSA